MKTWLEVTATVHHNKYRAALLADGMTVQFETQTIRNGKIGWKKIGTGKRDPASGYLYALPGSLPGDAAEKIEKAMR